MLAKNLKPGMVIQLVGNKWAESWINVKLKILKIEGDYTVEEVFETNRYVNKGLQSKTGFTYLDGNGFILLKNNKTIKHIRWL
jgi:hypothetical protein